MSTIYYSVWDSRYYVSPHPIKNKKDISYIAAISVTELLKHPDLFELLALTEEDLSEEELLD